MRHRTMGRDGMICLLAVAAACGGDSSNESEEALLARADAWHATPSLDARIVVTPPLFLDAPIVVDPPPPPFLDAPAAADSPADAGEEDFPHGPFDAGVADGGCSNEADGIDWSTISDDTKAALDAECQIFFAPPADAGIADAGVLDCNARSDLELSCYWTALAIETPPTECADCSTCPTSEEDADLVDGNGTPTLPMLTPLQPPGDPTPRLSQTDLDAGARQALGVNGFSARRDARLLQVLLEANAVDLVATVDGQNCSSDELVFFGGIQGYQTPADRETCEKDSPRLHGEGSIPDYDLLVDDPASAADKTGDNVRSARSAASRLRDTYGTDTGVGNMYWDYSWYGIERRFNANFTGTQLRRVTILNYYNASAGVAAAPGIITSPSPQLVTRNQAKFVNGAAANVRERARAGRYKSYLGDKSDVRVLGAIANLPGLAAFVNADSSKVGTRVHATMVYKNKYVPWIKADIDDFPKHWVNLAPDWNAEAMVTVLRAYKCGQPILAHSGGGASLAYVLRMIDAYVQIANRSAMVARWSGRNLRVIGLEAAMSSEGATMLQNLPTFAHRAGILNFAGNVYMDAPRVAPTGTTKEDRWVDWSKGDPALLTKATINKAEWRNSTWNGTIRVAVYHLAGTLLETEAVDPYKTSWIPESAESWNHGDMSTSTQWTGWVAGRGGWDKDYKLKDLLVRPLDGDLKAAFLSNAFAKYVVAEDNGGGAVNADRATAGPWETFSIHDVNGGALQSTDSIYIGTSSGWYLCADRIPRRGGFTPKLNATRRIPSDWERMKIYKVDAAKLAMGVYATTAGPINDGDFVGIQSDVGNWMVGEAAGTANIDRPNLNAWEVFVFKKK